MMARYTPRPRIRVSTSRAKPRASAMAIGELDMKTTVFQRLFQKTSS